MQLYFFKGEREKREAAIARKMAERKYARWKTDSLREADYMLVYGGDGTMLEAERLRAKETKSHAKIIGMAYGTANSLMNKEIPLDQLIGTAQTVVFHPFEVTCIKKDGVSRSLLAFNETVIHRCSLWNQSCHLFVRVMEPKQFIQGRSVGDGLIVASRQGSPAYYYQAGGKFVDIWSANIGVQPICDRNAKNLSCVIPDTSRIAVEVCDYEKRPVIVNTDNNKAVQDVVHCEIQMNKQISVPVLLGKQTPIMLCNQIWERQREPVYS